MPRSLVRQARVLPRWVGACLAGGLIASLPNAASCEGSADDSTQVLDVKLVRGAQIAAAPLALTASDGTGLVLRELTAKIVLEPPLAFTEIELAFQNPEARRLEGRFEITLPEAASISRLALQIGERFQEGEIVERQRAHVAYEEALHARRDPALLERDAGNQYGVRVFPIEAHEVKRVIVAYSQVIAGDEAAYRLPLAGLPRIDRVRFEVTQSGAGSTAAPTKSGAGSTAAPTKSGAGTRVFVRRAWRPSGDLEVSLPEPSGSSALVHEDMALLHVRPALQSNPTALSRLTVLFDTSASRAGGFEQAIERMQAIVKALGERHGRGEEPPLPVQLVFFDQEVLPLLQAHSDQLGPDLTAQLLSRGALGATDLEAALRSLTTLEELGDRVLVFTDGVASAGASDSGSIARGVNELRERGVQRLDVVTHAGVLERTTLDALVHAELPEAGVVVSDHDPVAAVERLLRGTERRVDVEIEGAEWTFPSVLAGVEPGRAYPVFAKLRAGAAAPQLWVGGELVRVSFAKASTPALLQHEWARARIAHLQARMTALPEADAERARTQIVQLSQRHRVLSDHTALVVLETEGDYARHRIARTRLSDVLRVEDGVLASAQEPQAAREAATEDFGGIGLRGTGRGGGGEDAAIGALSTIGTLGVIGTIGRGPGGFAEGAALGMGRYGVGSHRRDAVVPRVRSGKAPARMAR